MSTNAQPPGRTRSVGVAHTCSPLAPLSPHVQNYRASFQETGDTESSVWSCGPVMGLIEDVPSCDALLAGMVEEAEGIIKGRLAAMCV